MAYDFRLPDLGEGIAEGELLKWLVKVGDTVEEHQEIAEVETDKAVVQVPSPRAGKILELNAKPGDTVQVGEVLCTIGEEGEKVDTTKVKPKSEKEVEESKPDDAEKEEVVEEPEKPKAPKKKGPKHVPAGAVGELEEAPDEEEPEEEPKKVTPLKAPKKAAEPQVKALPAIRKLAQELGVNLAEVSGSGPEGRITEDDIRQASGKAEKAPRKGPTVAFDKFGRVLRIPLKGVRKTIAENMVRSMQTAAHVTHHDMIDVTELAEVREEQKKVAEEKGIKLTYLPFVVKACVLALKKFPYVNSSLDDQSQEIVIKQFYNIGIAVDTDHGLMVPVVKHADSRTIFDVAREIWRIAEMARTREIQLKDLQGSTFTITNVGSLGGWFATPIINYPETAILALGRIQEMAVPIEGEIHVRKMLPVSLSFDHRVIDGALAAKFVNEIKIHLEDPDALFMGY